MSLQESISTDFESRVLSGYEENVEQIDCAKSDMTTQTIKEAAEKIKVTAEIDPLEFLHAWMKAEEREVEGFLDSIKQRDRLIALKLKLLEKQRSTGKTLEKVACGNLTLRTLFSTKGRNLEMDEMERQIAGVSNIYYRQSYDI